MVALLYTVLYTTRTIFSGDFNVTLDFNITSMSRPIASANQAAYLRVDRSSDSALLAYISRCYHYSTNVNGYQSGGLDAGFDYNNTPDPSGSFRIQRISGAIRVYWWNGSSWEWEGNPSGRLVTNSDSSDVVMRLYFIQAQGGRIISDVDNFSVTYDDIVCAGSSFSSSSSSSALSISSSSESSSSYSSCTVDLDDDFDGTNGDPPNIAKWSLLSTTGPSATILNNKLNFVVSPASDQRLYL